MKVLATVLLFIPLALFGQEQMNDVEKWEDQELYSISWGTDFDWSVVEVWNDDKIVHTSKLIKDKRGHYVIPKGSLPLKERSTMTVFIIRSRHGLLFRDQAQFITGGKNPIKLRSQVTSSN